MIIVDTSVWVEVLRNKQSSLAKELSKLLDDGIVALPVLVLYELLSGASREDQSTLRVKLSALPILYPGTESWKLIETWIYTATKKGERFGIADLIISSIANEHKAKVWSLDKDFQRMAKLGFVKMHH